MHLICRHCSTRLSPELERVSISERNEAMGADFLHRGTVMQEDGSYFHGLSGEYIVHANDVLHVHLTLDSKRLQGCRGLDGCDGPNLQCDICEMYVATKMTDCWQPHCVIFDKAATHAVAT
jgi:hypothetical protein